MTEQYIDMTGKVEDENRSDFDRLRCLGYRNDREELENKDTVSDCLFGHIWRHQNRYWGSRERFSACIAMEGAMGSDARRWVLLGSG